MFCEHLSFLLRRGVSMEEPKKDANSAFVIIQPFPLAPIEPGTHDFPVSEDLKPIFSRQGLNLLRWLARWGAAISRPIEQSVAVGCSLPLEPPQIIRNLFMALACPGLVLNPQNELV